MFKPSRLAIFQDSSDPRASQSGRILLALFGLSFLIIIGYAVFQGEPVTADVTPTHVHLEVGGRSR